MLSQPTSGSYYNRSATSVSRLLERGVASKCLRSPILFVAEPSPWGLTCESAGQSTMWVNDIAERVGPSFQSFPLSYKCWQYNGGWA